MSRTRPARLRTSPKSRNKRFTLLLESIPSVTNVVSRLLALVRKSWTAAEVGLRGFFRTNFVTLAADF